ncbi:MAG: hypothetical protein ACOX36_08435 [Saccharofermentanales bacterium]|jgi:hypothetical protein
MNKLNAKKIKRHMLKTYAFWQLDERFLMVYPDKNILSNAGLDELPETESGYLAFVFLDDTMKVAFLGEVDLETQEYAYFQENKALVAEASSIETMLVMLVKPTRELVQHPFVKTVLDFHESNVLYRSTLTVRAIDPLRDPLRPEILTACYVKDEADYEQQYADAIADYVKALEEAEAAAEEKRAQEDAKKKSSGKKIANTNFATEANQSDGEEEELPQHPYVPEDAFVFVKIRDLSPANKGTWRAVLMEDLPGTKKKKDDDIAVSLVTVEEEGSKTSMLFLHPDAPVEGTKIHTQAYKPRRLPWRIAYELKCPNNDFDEIFYLGRSGEDSLMFRNILDDIREGKMDPSMVIAMVQRDDGEIDFSRELYRCNSCGTMEVMRRVRMIYPDATQSTTYRCPKCGERTSFVKRTHIASLNCPECREPLNLMAEKNWSGVLDPHSEPDNWR